MPGIYLLRRSQPNSTIGFEAAPTDSVYQGFINFPTTYGLTLPRILLFNHSSDVDTVHDIQMQIKVEEVPRPTCGRLPPLTTDILGNGTLVPLTAIPPESLNQTSANNLLQVVARVASYNPPIQSDEVANVAKNLEVAGISAGQYVPPQDVNYTAANSIIAESLIAAQNEDLETYGNQWVDWLPEYSGNFSDAYNVRSFIAYSGYLQLVQDVAIYPEWTGSGLSGLSLLANESYIMTFPSGKPPVDGFWSITAYNSTSYLIANPLNIYSLGDRSNITYPDGSLVYGSDNRTDPFSILIQPADVSPPQNWTSNWLPAPSGGGNFTVNCKYSCSSSDAFVFEPNSSSPVYPSVRCYGPTEPLSVGGSYIYPVVTKQGVIID